jgi:hypothetical protein
MLARPWRNMVWSSASSTLIGPLVFAFVIWFSANTSRSVPLVGLERHCTGLRLFGPRVVSLYFDVVGRIPTVLPASSSAIHRSAWKWNSAKFAPGSGRWHDDQRLMARRNPPGTGMLRLAAAILFIAGPIVALVFWSWALGAMVFGAGAIVLGIRQVLLGEHRSERFLGVALLLGGAFTVLDGLIRLLLGASP